MVKIRLRRTGSKHRPFYRMVVTKSTAARDGTFIEIIGTYNPVTKPKHVAIKEDRALHWLMQGAQPTEIAAILMNGLGILDKFFEARPAAKKQYKFLDKRTATMSVQSVVTRVEKAEPKPEPVAQAVAEEPAVAEEASAEPALEATVESPAEATGEVAPEAAGEPLEQVSVSESATTEEASVAVETPAGEAPAEAEEEKSE